MENCISIQGTLLRKQKGCYSRSLTFFQDKQNPLRTKDLLRTQIVTLNTNSLILNIMNKDDRPVELPDAVLMEKILVIRGKKVMLDYDLAALYAIETKQLKRAVRRNIYRFPEDFMIELSIEEFDDLRSQIGTSNRMRKSPWCSHISRSSLIYRRNQ